jgi:hypothetical protein
MSAVILKGLLAFFCRLIYIYRTITYLFEGSRHLFPF